MIPRIGASVTFYGTAVVRQFEMMGVFAVNESDAISRSRDKLRSPAAAGAQGHRPAGDGLRALTRRHPRPDQVGRRRAARGQAARGHAGDRRGARGDADGGRERDRGLPRPRREHPRPGVHQGRRRAPTSAASSSAARSSRRCSGRRPRASSARTCTAAAPRSLVKVTPEERSTAVRAARIMGLNVAGVDMLRSNHGAVVHRGELLAGPRRHRARDAEERRRDDHRVHREKGAAQSHAHAREGLRAAKARVRPAAGR